MRKLEEKKKKKLEKKNSRQGISAEVFGQFNQKAEFVAKEIAKSPETKNTIRKLIEKSILFSNLNKDDLDIVIGAMEELVTVAGQSVITEGEQGDTLYIIDAGEFDCFKNFSGTETYLKTYKSGDFFGELALMYNAPRAASIKSNGDGKLFGLDRATFNHIVQEAASKKRKCYSSILSKVEILAEIDPYEKEQLCDTLKEEEFQAGTYVVNQGDQGDRFYIIAEGRLIAEKKDSQTSEVKKVFEYKEGDYFGEIALVKNTVRQASIKTETYCRVVSIDRDAFKRLLGPMEEILQRNMDKYKKFLIQ